MSILYNPTERYLARCHKCGELLSYSYKNVKVKNTPHILKDCSTINMPYDFIVCPYCKNIIDAELKYEKAK